eukprot:6176246-Pleurochrysis_carterae.AAC.2
MRRSGGLWIHRWPLSKVHNRTAVRCLETTPCYFPGTRCGSLSRSAALERALTSTQPASACARAHAQDVLPLDCGAHILAASSFSPLHHTGSRLGVGGERRLFALEGA